MKRANYQGFIMKRALELNPKIPNRVGYDWETVYGKLRVCWIENKVAPEEIL